MCVNFSELNWLTIKNRYPLPLISGLLDQVSVQGLYQDWFTWGIQLGAYSRRWRMEDFISYMLWPFWVCCDALSPYKCAYHLSTLHEWHFSSIPKWFCGLLHWWHPHFSKNLEEHEWHVRFILDKLKEITLYTKLKKCELHQTEVEFLGYIIFGDDICMDFCKV